MTATYEFDESFQAKVAAMVMRDQTFNERCENLIKPDYFESEYHQIIAGMTLDYYDKYKKVPDMVIFKKLLKDAIDKKIIRDDMKAELVENIKNLRRTDISDRDYVIDEVENFAQFQAVGNALLEASDLMDVRDMDKIKTVLGQAMETGASKGSGGVDFFGSTEARKNYRQDINAGIIKIDSVSTGIRGLDNVLKHKGWGKKELYTFMGAAKRGKSTALGFFAKNAALQGKNVLLVSLEVSTEIYSDRLDASISGVSMNDLNDKLHEVQEEVERKMKNAGKFILHDYPTGSFSPADLRRLIARYKAQGIIFDMVVVDYADIMAPDIQMKDEIANSKSIYIGLRAIASEENVVMLTATQTNRDGAKATTARMTDVAEDFNKVRIADLVISINASEEERAVGEARLFFAASRNQKGEFTIRIKQDLERMQFLKKILEII